MRAIKEKKVTKIIIANLGKKNSGLHELVKQQRKE